jgi:hypothetical protein
MRLLRVPSYPDDSRTPYLQAALHDILICHAHPDGWTEIPIPLYGLYEASLAFLAIVAQMMTDRKDIR